LSGYLGDLVASRYPTTKAIDPVAGLFLRRNLGEAWSLRLQGTYVRLSGDDTYFSNNQQRGFSFTTQMGELAVLGEWDLRGHRRFDQGHLRKTLSPYLFGGVGLSFFQPTTNFNENQNTEGGFAQLIASDRSQSYPAATPVLPFGAGLRYDLSQRVTLGLEAGLRYTFGADLLDGVSASANPDDSDWYGFGGLTLAFRFGYYKDTDADRVLDRFDACPTIPGEKSLAGCPDADGDGIVDEKDQCPYQRGASGMGGCPDRDGDGVIDKEDTCPDEYGLKTLSGCPDKDNDGIADHGDACPDLAGPLFTKGCPDSDLDSIPNSVDKCPTEAGLRVNQGCPDRDTDGDGLVDRLDRCPDRPGLRVLDGCPDADGDGIVDSADKCPTLAGTTANGGCPEIKDAEREVLKKAVKGVQFDAGKATLKKTSFPILDQVVDVMKRFPSYRLQINGHTDSDGDDKKNLTLSQNRAKACRDYLASKGIDAARLNFEGFGETKPLVPNKTKANKAENRRVEFILE
jgi:outer membrane protein OmpA-like peptidoglycan-associated protein